MTTRIALVLLLFALTALATTTTLEETTTVTSSTATITWPEVVSTTSPGTAWFIVSATGLVNGV